MRMLTDVFKLMGDVSRVRILLLVDKKELCVSQISGILCMTQPLVSRNLSLLFRAGFLDDRKDGKMTFYRLKKSLPLAHACMMDILRECLCMRNNTVLESDTRALREFAEFQSVTAGCDTSIFRRNLKQRQLNAAN
jgi:ArsR family transcriptional regulator, arsenate/arsenite/antimonite-responsive transcriptional repressor